MLIVAVLALNLAVAVGVLLVQRPQRGVLLLAVLTPFDGLLLLAPDVGPLAGWKEALVLGTLAATFLNGPVPRPRALPWPPFSAAVVGLVAVSVLSALWVAATTGLVQALVGLKLNGFYVLLFIALVRCPLSRSERDRLVTILMSVGVLTAVVGLWQQAVGGDVLNALGYEYNETIRSAGGFLRSFSTFNQPFPFGFYVMIVLLVGLPSALADPRRLRNQLFLLSLPVLLAGMVSSIVRAALLGSSSEPAGVVDGASAGWPLRPAGAGSRSVRAVGGVRSPAVGLQPRRTHRRVVGDHRPGGAGATGQRHRLDRQRSREDSAAVGVPRRQYQPDNYYFKTAYELGPVGVWMLVLLLVTGFLTARYLATSLRTLAAQSADPEERRALREDRALAAGIGGVVVGSAAAMLVATYLEIFPIDLHFWLLLGVLPSLAPSLSARSHSVPVGAASRPTPESSSGP
jgi:hypothetical protein